MVEVRTRDELPMINFNLKTILYSGNQITGVWPFNYWT